MPLIELLEPVGRLVATAAHTSQLWIATHSRQLAAYIEEHSGHASIALELVEGETRRVGQGLIPLDVD